jgi:hypothetical protein
MTAERKTGVHRDGSKLSESLTHYIYWHDELDRSCLDKFLFEPLNSRNPYYAGVLQVLFAQNRIVLGGTFVKMLVFLQAHHQGLNKTHELDFQFDPDMIDKWAETNNDILLAEWEKLIAFMR